jgi:hypothetical protein
LSEQRPDSLVELVALRTACSSANCALTMGRKYSDPMGLGVCADYLSRTRQRLRMACRRAR